MCHVIYNFNYWNRCARLVTSHNKFVLLYQKKKQISRWFKCWLPCDVLVVCGGLQRNKINFDLMQWSCKYMNCMSFIQKTKKFTINYIHGCGCEKLNRIIILLFAKSTDICHTFNFWHISTDSPCLFTLIVSDSPDILHTILGRKPSYSWTKAWQVHLLRGSPRMIDLWSCCCLLLMGSSITNTFHDKPSSTLTLSVGVSIEGLRNLGRFGHTIPNFYNIHGPRLVEIFLNIFDHIAQCTGCIGMWIYYGSWLWVMQHLTVGRFNGLLYAIPTNYVAT